MAQTEHFINLDQFKVEKRETLVDTPVQQVVKITFDQGLIVVTTVDKADKSVKFHSNYGWKKDGNEWLPDLTQPNVNYHEAALTKPDGKHFKPVK